MTEVSLFSIYCQTESTHKEVWGTEAPSQCPTDTSHLVDLNSISIKQTLKRDEVIVKQETQGLMQHKGFKFDVPVGLVGDKTSFDVSFPYNVYLWESTLGATADNVGDVIDVSISPNTLIGVLTADVAANDTVLPASPTVFGVKQLRRGVEISLSNGVETIQCGRLIDIDLVAQTITIEDPLPQSFVAGNFINLTVKAVSDFHIHSTGNVKIGRKGMKALILPANNIIRFEYTNNSILARTLYCELEFYYE